MNEAELISAVEGLYDRVDEGWFALYSLYLTMENNNA
jgi:hypothetical protein